MKKYLIIEDEKNKFDEILFALISHTSKFKNVEANILSADNYTEAISILRKNNIDVILLDMSLPIRKVNSDFDYSLNNGMFSGLNILSEISRKKMDSEVILITAFTSWNDGNQVTSLQELDLKIRNNYNINYLGYVYFDVVSQKWQQELTRMLEETR